MLEEMCWWTCEVKSVKVVTSYKQIYVVELSVWRCADLRISIERKTVRAVKYEKGEAIKVLGVMSAKKLSYLEH